MENKQPVSDRMKDVVDGMMAYCLKYEQPIPRNKLLEVFKLEKIDLIRLEKQKLIKRDFYHRTSSTIRQPWVVAYFPANYEEMLKRKQEFFADQTIKLRATNWKRVAWYTKTWWWILLFIRMNDKAKKLYNRKTDLTPTCPKKNLSNSVALSS